MRTLSEAQKRAAEKYRKKCMVYAVSINPEWSPVEAARLAELKKSGQAPEFFKAALRDFKL